MVFARRGSDCCQTFSCFPPTRRAMHSPNTGSEETAETAVSTDRRPRCRPSSLIPIKGGHHVAGEPAQLFLEFLGRQAFGPVDHEVLEARIFRLDRFDAVDDLRRRPAEPCLLLHAVGERGLARRCAWCSPGPALLV